MCILLNSLADAPALQASFNLKMFTHFPLALSMKYHAYSLLPGT